MNFQHSIGDWLVKSASRGMASAEALNRTAERCEQRGPDEQHFGLEDAARALGWGEAEAIGEVSDLVARVIRLSTIGAYESAAIAMMPARTVFTGGALQNDTFIAQVVLESGAGAHSRSAKSLSMAWLAALLRALARQKVEAETALRH